MTKSSLDPIFKIINEWFETKFGIRLTSKQIVDFSVATFPISLSGYLTRIIELFASITDKRLFRTKYRKKIREIQELLDNKYGISQIIGAIVCVRAYSIIASTRKITYYRVLDKQLTEWLRRLLEIES